MISRLPITADRRMAGEWESSRYFIYNLDSLCSNTTTTKPFAPLGCIGHWQISSISLCLWLRSSSPQLSTLSNISASTLLLQLFLGRPLFLFPWGFHFRACQGMFMAGFLRVWPIQLYFCFRICLLSIGSWLVLFHRSTLLTLSFHQMFNILLRQVMMNVCSLCVVCFVVLNVSDPYSITCFTLELKMRIWVLEMEMFF